MTEFRTGQAVRRSGQSQMLRVVEPAQGQPGKLICKWDGETGPQSGVFDADELEPFRPEFIIGVRTR